MSESVKCATCKTEKPFSEMHTCMQANREYSVCDMNCMVKFYKGEIKPDFVITPDLEEMGKLGMNPKEYHLHKENLELNKQLAKANERVEDLEKELSNKELMHVGFTNGAQIKYAKDEEGAFYPDTDGDCYIPLYMLKSHEHRIETTSIEQLRKEQEK